VSEAVLSSLSVEPAGVEVPEKGWVPVCQAGKLLFEYHPELELVRVVQRKRPFVVDLKGYRKISGTYVSSQ
jgi:hypothetical protein